MNEQIIRLKPNQEIIIRDIPKEEYTFAEFCEITGISRSKLYRLRKYGKIIVNGKKINHSEVAKIKK